MSAAVGSRKKLWTRNCPNWKLLGLTKIDFRVLLYNWKARNQHCWIVWMIFSVISKIVFDQKIFEHSNRNIFMVLWNKSWLIQKLSILNFRHWAENWRNWVHRDQIWCKEDQINGKWNCKGYPGQWTSIFEWLCRTNWDQTRVRTWIRLIPHQL